MKVLFVYNPNSGQRLIKYSLWDILNVFANAKYNVTVHPTTKSNDCYKTVKDIGEDYDLVVVSGGDGTLNEALSAICSLQKKPKVGYIPAGTTNDFASSLKIPRDMVKAAKTIVKAKSEKTVDIGSFGKKHFDYVAAFGAFTSVSYATPQEIKNVFGHLAYVLSGIHSIRKIKAYNLTIKSNSQTIQGDYIFGMITNTYSVGGVYKLDSKNVKLDDGEFEVMLVKRPHDAIELTEITAHLLDQRIKCDLVQEFKASSLTISSKEKLSWTLDGEYGGATSKVKIGVIQKAVTIVV